MNAKKKISPQAILALREALASIYWKKEHLRDFIRLSLENSAIVTTINWEGTKRDSIKELLDRMINRRDIYDGDLMNLFLAVNDFTDFDNLDFWDEDGSKKKKAKQSVANLRGLTKGYFEATKDQEAAKARKLEAEKNLKKVVSLEDELNALKQDFYKIAANQNFQQRGFEFEKFLYDLFLIYDLEPKESFKIYGEQIDGAFTFQGNDYLLEAKWKSEVNRSDLAHFCFKVEAKFKTALGLLISIDGVTKEAVSSDFKSIIIMDGVDLIAILDRRVSLPDLLYKKRRHAIETGNIYARFTDFI